MKPPRIPPEALAELLEPVVNDNGGARNTLTPAELDAQQLYGLNNPGYWLAPGKERVRSGPTRAMPLVIPPNDKGKR